MGTNLSFDSSATEAELKAIRAYVNSLLGDDEGIPAVIGGKNVRVSAEEFAKMSDAEPKVTTEAVNDAPPAPTRRKPGPKPKPKPEPEPEADEAEADEDDVMGEPEADDDVPKAIRYSLDDAKSKAKELVGEGRTADVRKALQAVGCSRVSELSAGQVDDFLKALG